MVSAVLDGAAADAARDAQEARWLQAVAHGGAEGQDAWHSLFVAYRPRVLRRYHRCRVPLAVAEDLMQDVMLTLHDKAWQFRPGHAAGPWIMQVALNRLRDWLDRHDQKQVDALVEDEPPLRADPHVRGAVPQDVIDDCRRHRWHLFTTARPRAALALQLVHAEGWTMAELAAFLRTTEGTAKGFVHVERQNARAALAPCEPGD